MAQRDRAPCGVVLAFITEKKVVKVILEYLGLPTTGPPISPTRTSAAGEDTSRQMAGVDTSRD